jgi:hypothetical protein
MLILKAADFEKIKWDIDGCKTSFDSISNYEKNFNSDDRKQEGVDDNIIQ